jgi:hypothetical protein
VIALLVYLRRRGQAVAGGDAALSDDDRKRVQALLQESEQ